MNRVLTNDRLEKDFAQTLDPRFDSRLAQGGVQCGQQETVGHAHPLSKDCERPSLIERVNRERNHSVQQATRAMELAELEELLLKHRDVARILDLYERLRP